MTSPGGKALPTDFLSAPPTLRPAVPIESYPLALWLVDHEGQKVSYFLIIFLRFFLYFFLYFSCSPLFCTFLFSPVYGLEIENTGKIRIKKIPYTRPFFAVSWSHFDVVCLWNPNPEVSRPYSQLQFSFSFSFLINIV